MKKIVLFFYLVIVSISFSKSYLKDNKLVIEKEKFKIYFSLVEDNDIKVEVIKKGIEKYDNEFIIKKEILNEAIIMKTNSAIIKNYTINEEGRGYTVVKDGKKLYTSSIEITGENGIQETVNCYDKELFYGMGEANDKLTLMNKSFKIKNVSEYGNYAKLYIPFIFTNSGDSFYINVYTNDNIKFGKKDDATFIYTTEKNNYSYYFWNEKNPKENIKKFYKFSDSKSLLPKWAFGYIQSKYGYETQEEVVDIVKKFKEKNIPLSAIVLDLQWFKKMGDLDWNREKWPNPEELDKFLEENGVKLITISEPFYTVDSKNYKEFEENGLFGKYSDGKTMTWGDWWCFGSDYGAIMNPIAPKAQEIVGNKYINMMKTGIDAFWTDLGEPENADSRTMFNQYSEEEFHNYYNREWSKLVYGAVKREWPDKRVFILSRSGFTGSAKYGVSIWSGDVSSNFMSLKKQTFLGINSGMAGFSYWGSDVGGFLSGEKLPSEELFIRWMQFGVFTPVFRAHGAMSSREPWIYPGKAEEIITKYINLRYEMMPYIYSTAYETYKTGLPMMRALFLEYPNDNETENIGDQYFFGEYLMVAPILNSKEVEENREVYIPEDCYDFYDYKLVKKGKHIIKYDIEKIPVFIRKGAIIPFEKNNLISILLVPDSKTSYFNLFNDDGITDNYKNGECEEINITLTNKEVIFDNVKEEKDLELKILQNEKLIVKKVNLKKGKNIINL